MEKILLAAAEDGRFDVIMVGYNFLNEDRGEKVLKACREKNIGTVLMKTNPVGEYLRMKKTIDAGEKEGKKISELVAYTFAKIKRKAEKAEGFIKKYNLNNPGEIRDAAIRFVLSNPNVNTVCHGFRTFNDLEDYIKLSGSRLTAIDKKKLAAYAEGCGDLYCRHACGICESQCPNKVPVNTIMRYNHYFEAQGREKYAMVKYAELPTSKANLCQNCEGNCEIACPYDVPIHGLLILAHQRLTLV
jgi:predicted aldo/keto reductase-like oxidoreductase